MSPNAVIRPTQKLITQMSTSVIIVISSIFIGNSDPTTPKQQPYN